MKTIEQTRRELFEAAYKAQVEGTCAGAFVPDVFSRNMSDGAYMISPVQCAWWGFNAAMDAVVIELPPLNNSHIGGPDSEMGPSYEQVEDAGYDFAVKDCRAAIKSTNLGLKII